MQPIHLGKKQLLPNLVLALAQQVVVPTVFVSVAVVSTLVVSNTVSAAEEENEIGIPYEVVLPDALIHDAFPDEEFGDNYEQVKADRVAGADVDESLFPLIKVDQYSGGTSDPKTVYREMGEKYDTELMAVIEPAKDPEKALPKATVVAFDGYSGNEVTITFASQITRPSVSTEERIYMLISQPEEIDRERRRIEKQQRRVDRLNQKKKTRVTLPTSSPIEIINAN